MYIAPEQFESPLPKNEMCQTWELVILEKTKIYNDDNNNDDRQRTNFDLSLKASIVYKQAILRKMIHETQILVPMQSRKLYYFFLKVSSIYIPSPGMEGGEQTASIDAY